jgi:carbamoyltransferase
VKIKYRESFRPFAPAVLEDDMSEYFDLKTTSSPYMLFVGLIKDKWRKATPPNYCEMEMKERLYCERSTLPAITHVDFSARVQSVSKKTNPIYHQLLTSFKDLTGLGMLVNTSFNVRGEPIVCTPDDAYRCFINTEMDALVLGNHVFLKTEQVVDNEKSEFAPTVELD